MAQYTPVRDSTCRCNASPLRPSSHSNSVSLQPPHQKSLFETKALSKSILHSPPEEQRPYSSSASKYSADWKYFVLKQFQHDQQHPQQHQQWASGASLLAASRQDSQSTLRPSSIGRPGLINSVNFNATHSRLTSVSNISSQQVVFNTPTRRIENSDSRPNLTHDRSSKNSMIQTRVTMMDPSYEASIRKSKFLSILDASPIKRSFIHNDDVLVSQGTESSASPPHFGISVTKPKPEKQQHTEPDKQEANQGILYQNSLLKEEVQYLREKFAQSLRNKFADTHPDQVQLLGGKKKVVKKANQSKPQVLRV